MSKSKRKTLGRGLSALLGEETPATTAPRQDGDITTVPIEFLHPGEYQPRHVMDPATISELSASIAQKGVLQPLLVRQHSKRPGEFEIIAGERRWRASQQAQLHEVPVIVKEFSDAEALEVGLVENLQRQDLSPIEEADGYQRLMDEFKHTQEIMAQVVGKSRSHIANTLRLLKLPEDVRAMVEAGKLTAGHARTLIGSEQPLVLARKIVASGLNVRQAELLANKAGKSARKSGPSSIPSKDADTLALERNMTALLGLQVDIATRATGGVLTIHYKTLDQLDDVLHRLSNGPRGASSIPADADDISFSEDMSDLQDIFEEDGEVQVQSDDPKEGGQSSQSTPDQTLMDEPPVAEMEPVAPVEPGLADVSGEPDDPVHTDDPNAVDPTDPTDSTDSTALVDPEQVGAVDDLDKLMAEMDEPLLGDKT